MGKIKSVLILPDVHLEQEGGTVEYKLAKKLMRNICPDYTILLGDFASCTAFSPWIKDKKLLLEGKRYRAECEVLNRELDEIAKYSGNTVYCEGNHEDWVNQYIEKNPSHKGDLELPIRLELRQRGIKWIPKEKYFKLGHLFFHHGHYVNKYHAQKHLSTWGCCMVYGHTHSHQVAMMNMRMQEPIMAWGLGCLCDSAPEYLKGRHPNWVNQFAVAYVDTTTGNFNIYPVNIIGKRFVWNGKEYK